MRTPSTGWWAWSRTACRTRQHVIRGHGDRPSSVMTSNVCGALLLRPGYTLKDSISVTGPASGSHRIARESDIDPLRRSSRINLGCSCWPGKERSRPHTLEVMTDDGPVTVSADHVLIACGTRCATRPPSRGRRAHHHRRSARADHAIPREAIVVGGGVIGLEYASMLSALGAEVTVIDQHPRCSTSWTGRSSTHCATTCASGLAVPSGREGDVGRDRRALARHAQLESGKKVHGDLLLYAVGRETCATSSTSPRSGSRPTSADGSR